jgi:MULE transposase domain/SWIM zinc finger
LLIHVLEIGSVFESEEVAVHVLRSIANRLGFILIKSSFSKRVGGSMRTRNYICSSSRKPDNIEFFNPCPFKISSKFDFSGKLTISNVHLTHNHPLNQDEIENTTRCRIIPPAMHNYITELITQVPEKPLHMIHSFVIARFPAFSIESLNKKVHQEIVYRRRYRPQSLLIEDVKAATLALKAIDPGFRLLYQISPDYLRCIVFMGTIQIQYCKRYSDVIILDTTYKTNKLGRPLLQIIGIDCEGENVLLLAGLLVDEKIESFRYALAEFRKLIEFDPNIIISDEDAAISAAIVEVLPESQHRLCIWHLTKNLKKKTLNLEHIHFNFSSNNERKNAQNVLYDLAKNFNLESDLNEKFEILRQSYGKQSVPINHVWDVRRKWAASFFTGLTLGVVVTSRVESAHSSLKRKISVVQGLSQLLKSVMQISTTSHDKKVKKYERKYEKHVKTYSPMLPYFQSLLLISSFAAHAIQRNEKLATNLCFNQLDLKYIFSENSKTATVTRIQIPERRIFCDCFWFISMGIPCQHIIKVVYHEKEDFPDECINKRWFRRDTDIFSLENDPVTHAELGNYEPANEIPDPPHLPSRGRPSNTTRRIMSQRELNTQRRQQKTTQKTPMVYKCGFCHQNGHNRRRCQTYNQRKEQSNFQSNYSSTDTEEGRNESEETTSSN